VGQTRYAWVCPTGATYPVLSPYPVPRLAGVGLRPR